MLLDPLFFDLDMAILDCYAQQLSKVSGAIRPVHILFFKVWRSCLLPLINVFSGL